MVSSRNGLLTAIVGIIEDRDQEIAPTGIGIESVWERPPDRDGVRDREISHRAHFRGFLAMASSKKSPAPSRSLSTTVYSTDPAPPTRCRQCFRLVADCVCGSDAPKKNSTGDGIIRLARETKGRKGTGVTLVKGLPLSGEELEALASRLKKLCGVGGTVREGVIEIQGEQRARLLPELEKLGYSVKIAGA